VNENQQRKRRLEEAWGLGIQGYYEAALEIIAELLNQNPADLGSLRLRGNLLELKEMDRLEHSGKQLASSVDYLAARSCYERILELDPSNAKANIDLGDHYHNLDANDKAMGYYGRAASALQNSPKDESWREDVEELRKAVALLTGQERLASRARSIENWCNQVLA
jgi:tetratricopeptide (TPR) repeat protein